MSSKILYKIKQDVSPPKLFEVPKLQYVCLKINDLCNARCSFCDIWQKNIPPHKGIDWLAVIDDLISLNVAEINIHGGEAFLSKVFWPMLKHGGKRTSFSIITNGSLVDKFYDRLFEHDNIKRMYISIDHVDPHLNALSRGIKRLEEVLYPTMERIKADRPNLELVVNHVVTNKNVETIDQLILKMKQLGVDAVNLIPIKDAPDLFLTEDQLHYFDTTLNNLFDSGKVNESDFLNGFYKIFGTQKSWEFAAKGIYNSDFKTACIIPSAVMFVNGPDGNVYPCDTTMYRPNSEQYILGNLLESSIRDIWLGSKSAAFRAKMYPKITCQCIKGCDPANNILERASGDI